jgi:hypothetical protein
MHSLSFDLVIVGLVMNLISNMKEKGENICDKISSEVKEQLDNKQELNHLEEILSLF